MKHMESQNNSEFDENTKPLTIRVPPLLNVDIDQSVLELIDTPEFQKLRKIKQLSLTHLVYPGANHTRFEHSLGVFALMQKYIERLQKLPKFVESVESEHLKALPYAALLHDIGHYPFGHLLEGEVSGLPSHEVRSQEIIAGLTISQILKKYGVDPIIVGKLITGDFEKNETSLRLARDLLDSSVDADKMDYLERDSLHCGVPYGRSYDKERLIDSLTVSPEARLALTAKGKSSAEYIIFSRYIMLTDVYWHHTVRSAAIMLIRAMQEAVRFDGWSDFRDDLLNRLGDDDSLARLGKLVADDSDIYELVRGLRSRKLFKRIRTYSPLDPDAGEVFSALKGLSGPNSAREVSEELIKRLEIPRMRILVDIVPSKSMTQDITVFFPKRNKYRKLTDISPIAKSLAETWQSLTGVVRVYCHPSQEEKLLRMGREIDIAIIESAQIVRRRE